MTTLPSCSQPFYTSQPHATPTCPKCQGDLPTLRLNPHIIGPLLDETGSIASGSLIWSDAAWTQLLGRTAEELAGSKMEQLRYMEERMRWLRITLLMGWGGEDMEGSGDGGMGNGTGGRLCVLRVLE
jgi:hypothetical protein